MEANELILGNYYLSSKFNVNIKLDLSDFATLEFLCQGAELDSETIKQLFKPIELKEEDNLEKLGFNNIDYGYSKNIDELRVLRLIVSNGWFYPQIEESPELSNSEVQTVSLKRIKYVHELQFLYFTLSGEKLEWL